MNWRPAITMVLITALLDSVGFGIIMPVLPELLMDVTGEDVSASAAYGGWLMFAYAAMQFLLAPVIGGLSDRFGRRPVLLFSLFVLGIDYLIMWWAPSFAWLLVGRLIAGAAASTYSTCNAFIADISPPDVRAANFGLMGAAFGMGFIIGPVVGGLLGEYGARAPFLAAALLAFANLLYGLLVLPESLTRERRRPFDWRRANPTGTLASLRRYPVVFGVIGAYFLFLLGHHVLPSTWSFFTMERFDWSPREVGYSLGWTQKGTNAQTSMHGRLLKNGATEVLPSASRTSNDAADTGKIVICTQGIISLTAGDTLRLQHKFSSLDGYASANITRFWIEQIT